MYGILVNQWMECPQKDKGPVAEGRGYWCNEESLYFICSFLYIEVQGAWGQGVSEPDLRITILNGCAYLSLV